MTAVVLGNKKVRKSFSSKNPKLQIAWDSVSLGAFKKCPRYYQLTIVEGWQPKQQSHHLRYGQLYHRALEVYDHKMFEGSSHDEALAFSLRDLAEGCLDHSDIERNDPDWFKRTVTDGKVEWVKWWNPLEWVREDKRDSETKTVPNLFRTVIWYLDQFGEKDVCKTVRLANGKPAVELSFRYELGYTFATGEVLLHSGHLDRLVTLGDSRYFLDRKTTKNTINANSSWGYFADFSPNNQMTGYSFASKIALGIPTVGGIIDAAQIAKGFSRFERGFTMRTDAQLEEWRDDTVHTVKLAEHYASIDYWPMNDTACSHYGGCPLRGVCSRDPGVRQAFLQKDFLLRPWDPLEVRGDI